MANRSVTFAVIADANRNATLAVVRTVIAQATGAVIPKVLPGSRFRIGAGIYFGPVATGVSAASAHSLKLPS